jgi:hypothetical protein
VPTKAEEVNHDSATFATHQSLWAIYILMLAETKSLHVVFALTALNQNFSAHDTVGFHVALAEGFSTSVARGGAIGADHHVVRHVGALERIRAHGALDWPPCAFFLVSFNSPFGDHG